MSIKKWPLINDEEVLQCSIFSIHQQTLRSPKDGEDKNFYIIKSKDWVQVLPITANGEAILVKQFRQGSQEISLELPGGVIDNGEDPLSAAQRELMEETGFSAASWRHLSTFRPNPATHTNTAYFFVAEGAELTGKTNFDENEDLETCKVPVKDLPGLIKEGTINHAIMVADILSYFNSLHQQPLSLQEFIKR